LDCCVSALDNAAFPQTLVKPGQRRCERFGGPATEQPYHRHRRLLCARRQRPRYRAAEYRDELAASQVEHATTSQWADHRTLSLPQASPPVLGADMNCSESVWALSGSAPR